MVIHVIQIKKKKFATESVYLPFNNVFVKKNYLTKILLSKMKRGDNSNLKNIFCNRICIIFDLPFIRALMSCKKQQHYLTKIL